MEPASYRALQESASAFYRKAITPLLQFYRSDHEVEETTLGLESRRALQQSHNLQWQQIAFHRLLNLVCLSNEGLVSPQEVQSCRLQVIGHIKKQHPDGEWAEFTRDKLLFLQDLLFAACISEDEYHAAKKPLILRLAEQGAMIDTQDFTFGGMAISATKLQRKGSKTPARAKKPRAMAAEVGASPGNVDSRGDSKASPLKQVIAACRIKTPNGKCEKEARRIPHALDFLRPEDCPVRDPPSPQLCQKPVETESPVLLHPGHASLNKESCTDPPDASNDVQNWFCPDASPGPANATNGEPPFFTSPVSPLASQSKSLSRTPSRLKSILAGLYQKVQCDVERSPKSPNSSPKDSDSDHYHDQERRTKIDRCSTWGSDLLRPPRKLEFTEPEIDDSRAGESVLSENKPFLEGSAGSRGPNTVRLKKKVHSMGAPTDFFIDKVLGENIRNELSRIRAEMNKTQSGQQTFTNEQIDAIATRLPVDKADLKKFFPESWCERYGDIVLKVVRKEFKEHVGEMENLRKGGQHKRSSLSLDTNTNTNTNRKHLPVQENDENVQISPQKPLKRRVSRHKTTPPALSKCFTTLDQNSYNQDSSKKTTAFFQQDLDGTLEDEILRMQYGTNLRV